MSETNCARCSEVIEDTDVVKCADCEMDGICKACLAAHDCDEDSPQYRPHAVGPRPKKQEPEP